MGIIRCVLSIIALVLIIVCLVILLVKYIDYALTEKAINDIFFKPYVEDEKKEDKEGVKK